MKETIIRYYGTDIIASPDYGRIITKERAIWFAESLKGCAIITGGEVDIEKKYVSPTLVEHLPDDHPFLCQEIFGPVLPVISFESMDEITDRIKLNPNPLSLYYFTGSKRKVREMLKKVISGGACINDVLIHVASESLPFGGVGGSGIGRYHGKYSFETFSVKRSIVRKATWIDIPVRYPPYKNKYRLIRHLLK